jgi:hypothetical protein
MVWVNPGPLDRPASGGDNRGMGTGAVEGSFFVVHAAIGGLPAAGVTAALVLGGGLGLERLLDGGNERLPSERLVTALALGLGVTGLLLLGLGDLGLYHRWLMFALAACGLGAAVACHRTVGQIVAGAWGAWRRTWPDVVLPLVAMVGCYLFVVDLAMRAPVGGDEGDYKWATPVRYALHQGIVRLPARLSNGVYLSELLVVPAAVVRGLHGARLVQLLFVALLLLAARAVARRMGGTGAVAPFASAGALIVATGAVTVGSDNLVAALLVATWAVVLRGDRRSQVIAGLAFAAAVTTKQFTLLLLPVFVVLAICATRRAAEGRGPGRVRRWLPIAGRLVVPAVVVLSIGFLQTWALVGAPVDHYGLYIYPSSDIHVRDGRAAGRIPSLTDLAELPAGPALAAVRSREPYGRRTGVVLPVALLAVGAGLMGARRPRRRSIGAATAVAAASYLLLAPVFVKTRFLIFTWVAVFVAADVAVAALCDRFRVRGETALRVVTQLVLIAGFLDSTRWVLERYWWAPWR